MTTQRTRRTAVDSTAADYWTEYFGDYGKAWVKDIPRRVSAALAAELRQEVARRGRRGAETGVDVTVTPVNARSYSVQPDGGLVLEGFAHAAGVTRLFRADFSSEGALRGVMSRSMPAAPAAPTASM